MAWPTRRHRRFSSLCVSRSILASGGGGRGFGLDPDSGHDPSIVSFGASSRLLAPRAGRAWAMIGAHVRQRARPPRPPAVVALALARRDRARASPGCWTGWRSPSSARSAACWSAPTRWRSSAARRSAGPDRSTSAARCSGALFFGRLADRLGRKRLFLLDARGLHGARRSPPRSPAASASFVAVPLRHRHRHRRRVRGDQLRDRRADPGARARPRRTWRSTAASGSARRSARCAQPGAARRARARPACSAGAPASCSAAVLAVAILLVRRHVPESPRWLLAHGRAAEAERIVAEIETRVRGAAAGRSRRPRADGAAGWRARRAADAGPRSRTCCCAATRGAAPWCWR